MKFHKIRYPIQQKWLLVLAGFFWTGAGIILCYSAFQWLLADRWQVALAFSIAGCAAGILACRFGFVPIARANVLRIRSMEGSVWPLKFQSGRSFVLTGIMMTFGAVLRHSELPTDPLAVIYLMIGMGLLIASIYYYRAFGKMARSGS